MKRNEVMALIATQNLVVPEKSRIFALSLEERLHSA